MFQIYFISFYFMVVWNRHIPSVLQVLKTKCRMTRYHNIYCVIALVGAFFYDTFRMIIPCKGVCDTP
jgi:hypothetical protein